MITVHIKYLSATDHKPFRIKLTDGQNKLTLDSNNHTYREAAEKFISKYWPDCEVLNFGQLPNKDSEYVALAARQECA